MQSTASTVDEYIESLPEERKKSVLELRKVIKKNLPKGFKEVISYGMIGYVVPHSIYPAGYHCDPRLPLPYINIASQKNHIAIYHMGLYGILPCLNGSWMNMEKFQKQNPTWAKAAYGLKNLSRFLFHLLVNWLQKFLWKDILKSMRAI
jgi:hypothetical protein